MNNMIKTVLLLLISFILCFDLCGCKKAQLKNGIAVEFYCLESAKGDQIGDLYYLQNQEHIHTKNSYFPAFSGGTPKFVRNRVGSYFDTDGHGMYEEMGQLDDYYIDESIELYLYTKDQSSKVLYFKDGIQQPLSILSENCHRLQYMNGYLYLHPYPKNEDERKTLTIEKIHLSSGNSEFITYSLPNYGTTMPTSIYSLNRINSDGSLLESHYDLSPITANTGPGRFLSYLSYPDGRYYEIEPENPQKNKFALIFETEQGYGFLETNEREENSKPEDFFLKIRYFDRKGMELSQEEINCDKIITRSKNPVFLERGVTYHDGIIYFAVGDFEHFYNYTYDLEKKELIEGATFKGYVCEEYQVVRIENGNIYSVY